MALTDTEKAKCRHYLGYPSLFRYLNTRLEGTFTALDAVAEARIQTLLTALDALDVELTSAFTSSAGIKKVDEVEFFPAGSGEKGQIGWMRSRGRELVGRLSIILGVEKYADYFGESGYPGDQYTRNSGGQLNNPGGGGALPLG
jgi:hypothetical protein